MVTKNSEQELDCVLDALIAEAISRDWQHKYAKFEDRGKKSQSLYVHSVNVFSIVRIIGPRLFGVTSEDLIIACVAGFLHDYQKAYPKWQNAVLRFIERKSKKDDDFSHDDGSKESQDALIEFLTSVQSRISQLEEQDFLIKHVLRLLNIIVHTHDSENQSESMRRRTQVGPIDPLSRVVRLGDSIASKKDVQNISEINNDPDVPKDRDITFEYHQIGAIRGILSSFLNESLNYLMKEAGYIPLLYFGNGTAYLLEKNRIDIPNPRNRLLDLIDDQIRKFQESETFSEGLAKAAIGNYTQTKWPCIQAIRECDIGELFERISGFPGANRRSTEGAAIYKKIASKPGHKKIAEVFIKDTGVDSSEILSLMLSDFYVLVYFADFIKNYREFAKTAGKLEAFDVDLEKWLSNSLGFSGFDEISRISHTTPDELKIISISKIWDIKGKALQKKPNRRGILLSLFTDIIRQMLKKYQDLCPPFLQSQAKEILLSDIHRVPIKLLGDSDYREMSARTADTYCEGKGSKIRICNICGTKSYQTAIAGLTGDGSEKFSNFLPAGVPISGDRKAVLCQACVAEATIRSFFFGTTPAVTIAVFPDLSLTPDLYQNWTRHLQYFFTMETLGLNVGKSWNMQDVYKTILQGSIGDATKEIHYFMRASNPKVEDLAKFLKDIREDPNKIRFKIILETPAEITHENIAEYHLTGRIQIEDHYLKGYDAPSRNQYSCYFTPSHLFLFQQYPLKEDRTGSESESTSSIRLLLMTLIISEVFSGRVMVQDGFNPLTNLSVQGLVNIQIPPPASRALEERGIHDIVLLHESECVLRKLSALVLIAQSYVERLGKDRLLRIASMNRGAILRRAQMEKGKASLSTLLNYLEFLPSISDNHSTKVN